MTLPFRLISSTIIFPPVIVPVVVIAEEPLSIAPNPEVIEPLSKAPTVTILPPPTLEDAIYVDTVSTLVIRIVPASLIRIPSPLANEVVPLAVSPSIRFNSVVVIVASSRISSSASLISALPIVTVPEKVTLVVLKLVRQS
jgi:hypothetical protein